MNEWPFAYSGILAHLLCMSWHYQRIGESFAGERWRECLMSSSDQHWLSCQCDKLTALLHPQMRPVGEASKSAFTSALLLSGPCFTQLYFSFFTSASCTEHFSSFLLPSFFLSFHCLSLSHSECVACPPAVADNHSLRASHPFLFVCLCNFFHYAHHFRAVLFLLLSAASFADARLLGTVRSLHQPSSEGAHLN